MKQILLFTLLLIATTGCYSQVLRRPVAAPYTGMGAYSLNHTDIFSFTSNQASLAQLKHSAAGVFGERRFLLEELAGYTVVVGLRTPTGNFGVKANYAGSTLYRETQLGLAFGRKLGNKLDIGAQANYYSVNIPGGYGHAAIGFEIGTVFHINERLHTGIHVSNPAGGKFGSDKSEKIAAVYSFGAGYDAGEKLLVTLVIEKEEAQPINVNAGFQYKFLPQLFARAGMASATSSAWLGVGFSLRSFRLDMMSSYHPQLGVTPGLLLLIDLKGKEK